MTNPPSYTPPPCIIITPSTPPRPTVTGYRVRDRVEVHPNPYFGQRSVTRISIRNTEDPHVPER